MAMTMWQFLHPGENVIAALTPTVVAGTADPAYGVANLVDGNPYSPFKTTGLVATLQWDHGVAKAPAWIQIIHANITGTISLTTNDAAGFGGAGESYPLTAPAVDVDGFYADIYSLPTVTTARRYWRLVITGNTTPVVIGELWFGTLVRALTHDPAKGIARAEKASAVGQRTVAGVEMNYDLGFREEAARELVIITSRLVGEAAVRNWHRLARGRKPFPVVDSLTGKAWLARFDMTDNELVPTTLSPHFVTFTLQIKRVSRGLSWP